jgi:CopG family nickel-responsive transcriptional regulator
MDELKRISMSLEGSLLARFDRKSERQGYPTRSEAIKALMRQSLVEQEWTGNQEVAGAVSLVYDHHRRGTSNRIMGIQHRFGAVIVSTQHVHLDHSLCLEIVVVRGKAGRIQDLSAALKSVKGIKHAALMMTTAGKDVG